MMKNKIITLILVAFATITNAQNTFTAEVLDSENKEVLIILEKLHCRFRWC